MEFKINGKNFYALKNISQIKKFEKSLKNYQQTGELLNGHILFDLNYFDNLFQEAVTNFEIKFNIYLKDDVLVENVILENVTLEVVENQGINYEYYLNILTKERNVQGDLKKEISDDYDELLKKSLEDNHELVEVVRSPLAESKEIDFELEKELNEPKELEKILVEKVEKESKEIESNVRLQNETITEVETETFIELENSYSCMKVIFVKDDQDINDVANKYHLSITELYQKNDLVNNKRIILDINE